jgi:hypothetical protein
VIIDHCYLEGWTTGIEVAQTATCSVSVTDTAIAGGTTGVRVSMTGAGSSASFDNVHITGTTNAIDLQAGAVDVSHSLLSQNSGIALFAEGGTLNAFDNVLASNGTDVKFTGGTVNTFNSAGPVSLSLGQDTTASNVAAGQAAVFHLTITPPPGGFTAPVNFSTAGLPDGLTATFSPASLAAGSGATDVTLTVGPTPSAAAALPMPTVPAAPPLALLGVAMLLAALLLRPTPRLRLATLVPMLCLGLLFLAGCGGGGGGNSNASGAVATVSVPSATPSATPSPSPSPSVSPTPTPLVGAFPFTVTATSGTTSVSQVFTVSYH